MIARLRKHALLLGAVLCAALAALLVLLAVDAVRWRTAVSRDDLRFRALPTHGALWAPGTVLPSSVSSTVIGTGSTVEWRRALQYFWYSRIGSNPLRMDAPTIRAAAQDRLITQLEGAPSIAQQSTAANLLGILVVTTPAPRNDQSVVGQILDRAAKYFQQSIALDPGNAAAKQNLEIVLRIQKPGRGRIGHDARSGYGFGRGEGSGELGNGY